MDSTVGTKNYRWLKISVDAMSAFFVIFMFVIFPILGHYKLNTPHPVGQIPTLMKLLFADAIPATFGMIWLIVRYADKLPWTKYIKSTRDRIAFSIIALVSTWIICLIVQSTLFRWIP